MDGGRDKELSQPFVRLGVVEAVQMYVDHWAAGLSAYYGAEGLHVLAHSIRHTSEARKSDIQDLITTHYKAMRSLMLAAESTEGGHLLALDKAKRRSE